MYGGYYYGPFPAGIEEKHSILPKEFYLAQNYPNPTSFSTHIEYGIPKETHVSIKVYSLIGRLVRKLTESAQKPGIYRVYWDGKDDSGKKVASGIYFYRLEAGEFKETRKLTILK